MLRINVGSLVSKYVGDTEKQISKVFEMARAQQAILLFDEADALFTKRTQVESSQDKFANMETNQLLQEIERHDGVTLLTTNLIANLDPAFARRIGFRVQFPYPTVEERGAIWERLIPAEVPLDGPLDFEDLAERFDVSGGYIKNAIVQACYAALAAGRGLTQEDLYATGRKACEAAGRLVREWSDWD